LKKISIKNLINKFLLENKKYFLEKNINMVTDLEDFDFEISNNHFYILFSNLIFNAVRYSEKN
jgi:hypothetical protein